MKTIRIPLSEEEYQKIVSLKGKKSWRDFLFELVKQYEEITTTKECIPDDKIHQFIQRSCKHLTELAQVCATCKREDILLRICSNDYKKEHLLRAIAIILSTFEEELDEYSAWIVRILKAVLIEVGKGNVESAREVLNALLE